jgi:transcriptional regulator with GAF, ATPase, and Fis domain
MTEAAHGACRRSIRFMKGAVMREDLAISEATSQEKISDEAIREEVSRIADSPMFNRLDQPLSPIGSGRRFEQIIGDSPALRTVLEQVERVAPANSTVLIRGETGSGKELIAHAIHNASPRRGRPLIKLNCAAIPFACAVRICTVVPRGRQ